MLLEGLPLQPGHHHFDDNVLPNAIILSSHCAPSPNGELIDARQGGTISKAKSSLQSKKILF
jgi:hypothetical protein